MSKTLVIVESPSKAKTIGKYLGSDYIVKSSIGHVRDLPKSNKDAVDIEGGFIPHYIVSPGKEKVIADLKSAAKKADAVLLASDPDREGEAIAWHVAELIKDTNKHLKRIVFHEITEDAVKEAIKNPRDIDINLKEAQEARRVLDRLVGYDLSGLIWKKVRYGLSAGRVQSPALRILMEKEREIRAFIPEAYYVLTANTKLNNGAITPFICTEEPKTTNEADRIKSVGEAGDWLVKDVKETEQKRQPRPPFTTSTLQQVASTRLGFSPSRTMRAAQKLYEAGHITYMRTDSTNLSKQAVSQILAILHKEYGADYVRPRVYKTQSKSAQEAHEAIRPTNAGKKVAGNTADEKALYELIWRRAVSSQMSEARVKRTKIITNLTVDKQIPDFSVNGSRIMFDGWLAVDTMSRGEDTEVPKVEVGEKVSVTEIVIDPRETLPPNRYTEAGLIKELEKRGIGRPSTYASIMQTLADRGYVEKQGRTLIPTDTGDVVSTFLETYFPTYISDTFTSDMEDELDDIATGDRTYKKTLTDFYKPFHQEVESKADIEKVTNLGMGPAEFPCPVCGKEMVIKLGKSGKFLSCIDFPNCTGSRLIDGSEVKDEDPIGVDPDTGLPVFALNGKFGPYVQLGTLPDKKDKKAPKPRRASLPKGKKLSEVTLAEALHYLSLPRELGLHPETNEPVIANVGRYGPYIGHGRDFRSLKAKDGDDPYTITFERALEILKKPKGVRKGEKIVKELGVNPKTKKQIIVYESKSGQYLRKGFKRIMLPDNTNLEKFTLDDAIQLLQIG